MSREVSVEATGETVGEAKWKALRDLERLAPGVDKASVRYQIVSEGERGLLGVGYMPARVIAAADAPDAPEPAADGDLSEVAARVRNARRARRRSDRRRIPRRRARDGGGDLSRVRRRRRRTPDREARPDDRRAAVRRERGRASPRRGEVGDRRRCRAIASAAARHSRALRCAPPTARSAVSGSSSSR